MKEDDLSGLLRKKNFRLSMKQETARSLWEEHPSGLLSKKRPLWYSMKEKPLRYSMEEDPLVIYEENP